MYNSEFFESRCNDIIRGSGTLDRGLYRSIQIMGCHAVANESLAEAILQPGKDFIARGALQKLLEVKAARQQEIMRLFNVTVSTSANSVMDVLEQDMKVKRFH